jgi:hypothetical protein
LRSAGAQGRNGPFLATPIAVWDRVLIDLHFDPGAAIAVGPGDVAGALAWALAWLSKGVRGRQSRPAIVGIPAP